MQVLHVIPTMDPAYGGPTQALVGLALAQREAGLDARVIATVAEGEDESLVQKLEEASLTLSLIRGCRGPLRTHPELNRRVHDAVEQADIVHIHTIWEQIQHVAARTSQQIGKPYIIRPCGMLSTWALRRHSRLKLLKKKLYYFWRLRRNLNRAAAIHFTTEFEQQEASPLGITAPVIIEPSGIDVEHFANVTRTGAFRRRYGLNNRPLVMYLGRIFPGKGLEVLIPAMAQVKPDDSALAVIGPDSGGHQRTIEAMIARHQMQDRAVFTGLLSGKEKLEALADADLFCLPSDHENFGLVVVEALAAGTPVIVSDKVGVHHRISEGGVGGVVPRDATLLADEISRWLGDPKRLKEAADRTRSFVDEHFSWKQITQRWQQHYQRIVEQYQ